MQENYKNYSIDIEQDDCSGDSPREWDNLATMYYRSRDYILGDVEIPREFYDDASQDTIYIDDPESFKAWRKAEGDDIAVMLPISVYEHSGITMHVGRNTDAWDGSDVGWIVVTKAQIRANWNIKRVTAKYIKQAEDIARSEVKTFAQYLEGDIYRVAVNDPQGGEVDNCGGYYGYDQALAEAHGWIDYDIELKRKQRIVKVKQYIKSSVPLNYRKFA